jgi:hypothetical protein
MLRTASLAAAAVLAFAACFLALACGQTCKCEGDTCGNCSGTTSWSPTADGGSPPVGDAAIEATAADAADGGDQATIDATNEAPAPDAGTDANLADSPGERSADASDEDAAAATNDAGDAGADGCVCSMAYGPCGALNPCGCCKVFRLTCGPPSVCLSAP